MTNRVVHVYKIAQPEYDISITGVLDVVRL
jgi:hypothetical protein